MKQHKRQNVPAATVQTARLSARVSVEAYQRLFVASVMNGETAAEILDRLILAHCREWSLPGKIVARNATHDRVAPAPELNCNAPSPALQDAA